MFISRVIDDESITRGQEPGILSRNRIRGQNGRFRSYRSRFTAALWISLCLAPALVDAHCSRDSGHVVTSAESIKSSLPLWENVLTPGVTRELCRAVAYRARMRVRVCTCVLVFLSLLWSLSLSLSRLVKSVDNCNDNDYDVTDVTIMERQVHADRLWDWVFVWFMGTLYIPAYSIVYST